MSDHHPVETGAPHPLGATPDEGGVNFSVFSKYAERMELLLFAGELDDEPERVIEIDAATHRTHHYWHVRVPGIGHGQVYAWRVHGPDSKPQHRYDGIKVLLDPYGRAVTGLAHYDRAAARAAGDNCASALRSVVVDNALYDWQDDAPLGATSRRPVIYEMHVAGFTKSPNSGVDASRRGTYAGLIDRIPYLQELGITAVELLPIHQFDPQDAPAGRTNYWGYSSVSYFAPHAPYAADQSPVGPVDEFRDLVKALHRAGIRVILDVVYNHTAEAGLDGPLLCWAGFENSAYYLLQSGDQGYADFTGCGNTINANHSIVRRMILDSLRYWVREMHVDGFRFDLASALARGEDGEPMDLPPVLWAIESDPELAGTHLIAEAWDAAGLYQVGSFTGERFAQWNGPFRDDVRAFLRGDQNVIERLMARLVGSPDLFRRDEAQPWHSINYVTCHDGFSLWDLVSYDQKHNAANGEKNRDGSDHNLSWNCGVEGPTADSRVLELRRRQARNFLCLLFLSHGTPMLTMGDEILASHAGNNNPWCQDNEINWLDWNGVHDEADFLRFTRGLISFADELELLQADRFWSATSPQRQGEISWHGVLPGLPDWSPGSKHLAYSLAERGGSPQLYLALNAESDAREFTPPELPLDRVWALRIDTSAEAPNDLLPRARSGLTAGERISVDPHSIMVLVPVPKKS